MKTYKKKLIEVAIPLEVINAASAREKSIRHGHPSTLHLWWARRPLAACRAVLFAQLVDDPSSHPDKFPTEEAVEAERKRLFEIIEELVKWENSTNEGVLERARAEIRKSCGSKLPRVYDPFSGGCSIPLEAQRLGLPAYGSDLNPVAVMIGKAMIEIPPKFKNQPPTHPGPKGRTHYRNADGLAEDVKYYGEWPSLRLKENDLAEHFGRDANVGIILGQSSSWLVDVDLDSPEAVNFADRFLPPTGTVFGRTSKPRSHRLYYCRGVKTEQFQDPIDNKMVVEIRSGPGPVQTIFPPSIHPSGEQIKWAASEEPASVEPQELWRCVSLLASYCLLVRYLPADQAPPGDVSPDSWLFERLPPEIRAVAIEWAGVSGRSPQPPIGTIHPMPTDIYVTIDPADKLTAMDKIAQVDAVQRYIEQAGFKLWRPAPYHLKCCRISYFPTKMKIMFDGDPKPRFGQSPDDFLRLIRDKRI